MAEEVIKKDGSKVPFSSEKIMNAISAAANQTDLSDDVKNRIVEEVSGVVIDFTRSKEAITTSEIKGIILAELDKREPMVSAAWRAYEKGKK
jgi:transcriptional regulator NrdR family protein